MMSRSPSALTSNSGVDGLNAVDVNLVGILGLLDLEPVGAGVGLIVGLDCTRDIPTSAYEVSCIVRQEGWCARRR